MSIKAPQAPRFFVDTAMASIFVDCMQYRGVADRTALDSACQGESFGLPVIKSDVYPANDLLKGSYVGESCNGRDAEVFF